VFARIFSTIQSRRAERPGMVSLLGWGFCAIPLILALAILMVLLFSRTSEISAVDAWVGLAIIGVPAFLLGYGLLTLKRTGYWALLAVWALGSAVYLVDDLRAGKFPLTPVLNLFWPAYLLQPSVRGAFRY